MELDRETQLQIAVSTLGVAVFIAAAVYVSSMYTSNGGLSEQGGIAIVGVIGLFVVVMTLAGLWLERQNF